MPRYRIRDIYLQRGFLAEQLKTLDPFPGEPIKLILGGEEHEFIRVTIKGHVIDIPPDMVFPVRNSLPPEPPAETWVLIDNVIYRGLPSGAFGDRTVWQPYRMAESAWEWPDIFPNATPVTVLEPVPPATEPAKPDTTVNDEWGQAKKAWDDLQQWLRYHPNWKVTVDPWGMYGCIVVQAERTDGHCLYSVGRRLNKRLHEILVKMRQNEDAAIAAQGKEHRI